MIHSYALEKKHLIQLIFFQFTPWTWKITILIEFRDDSILFVAFAVFSFFFSPFLSLLSLFLFPCRLPFLLPLLTFTLFQLHV